MTVTAPGHEHNKAAQRLRHQRVLRRMRQAPDMCAVCCAVEKRRHPSETARTAAMRDVVAWMFGNELGVGLPEGDAGSGAAPALFASLEGLARADAAPSAP